MYRTMDTEAMIYTGLIDIGFRVLDLFGNNGVAEIVKGLADVPEASSSKTFEESCGTGGRDFLRSCIEWIRRNATSRCILLHFHDEKCIWIDEIREWE